MSELRIAVLVKQVPDPALVEISEDGRLMRENVPAMIDPFGKMALQHAVALKCTKLIMENVDTLKAIYPALGSISRETALLGFNENTPLHPGAARYYKEIGLNVDSLIEK